MKLDGYTRMAAVVANPIKHSISPFIHNRAFEATATNGAYVAWEIEAGDLAETVANIRRYQMFGINLSMPYKEQVIPYLDELSDEARLIGAVNTVVNQDGTLIGYNTDGKGFFKSLPSFTISDKRMTILGAGGAAKSILAQAILDGDIIEWRADFLAKDAILQVAPAIFEKFAGRELVFTLRTRAEGGEIELSSEEYVQIIKEVTQLYQPDYVDFEYFSYKDVFEEMLDFPNLVLSYHNFQETPENMMEILSELTSLSPKVVKVSVMAHTEQDVLDLMNYTRGFKTLNPEQEYVTISMGKMGKVSRITSDVTGSSWSFASLDEASAPGQISLSNMKKIREILDEA